MKKILVTGGAGFLGSHLCKRLIDEGNHVTCLDNLQTGSLSNIKNLLTNKNFQFLNQSVTDRARFNVDEIYNLACPASPVQYQKDPIKTMMTSVVGTDNMLVVATYLNAKLLQASTSEIYGDPLEHPQKETYWGNVNTQSKRACYDEGKRAAETLCFDYQRQFGTRIKVARIFNTYGPNMAPDDGRVVSNFIVQALEGKPLTVQGAGTQTRSFCYVSDLIDGLVKLMETDDTVTGPVNLGNPVETTVVDLARTIINITNSTSKIEHFGTDVDDPKKRQPDISLARTVLNWQPTIDLSRGLKETVDYFKKQSGK